LSPAVRSGTAAFGQENPMQGSADHPQRRRIRLAAEAYAAQDAICLVPIAVKGRVPVFSDSAVAAAAVETLRTQSSQAQVPIYAYCVMPDDVHLVLSPSARCDVVTFVGQFKNLAQRAAWRLGVRGAFWQSGFWDHFLRREEHVEAVVAYVLNNPVRAGLAESSHQFPFSGSLVFDLGMDGVRQADGGGQAPALREEVGPRRE
jgi:putative transposase